MENKDVSSVNNFTFADRPSNLSLIQMRKSNGPRIEPWRTAVTSVQQ